MVDLSLGLNGDGNDDKKKDISGADDDALFLSLTLRRQQLSSEQYTFNWFFKWAKATPRPFYVQSSICNQCAWLKALYVDNHGNLDLEEEEKDVEVASCILRPSTNWQRSWLMAFDLGGWLELGGRFVLDESTDSQISIFSPCSTSSYVHCSPSHLRHWAPFHKSASSVRDHLCSFYETSLHTFFDPFSHDLNTGWFFSLVPPLKVQKS